MPVSAIDDILAQIANSSVPAEERHIPTREPWLSAWCRLHSFHLAALERIDAGQSERGLLVGACHVADAKYKLWLGSIGAVGGVTP